MVFGFPGMQFEGQACESESVFGGGMHQGRIPGLITRQALCPAQVAAL